MAAPDAGELLLHLKLAFRAGEVPANVLTLARKAGGGSITPHVQHFLLENCTGSNVEGHQNCTYTSTILKRIISEVELSSDVVIDELYEEFAQRMLSRAKDPLQNRPDYINKEISFLSSEGLLGSGVGLVGICLNYIGASKVILTDGDASTLQNMKENMELNNVCIEEKNSKLTEESTNKVECKYLSWEGVSENDLRGYKPDIVLGADIMYDPICVPHLTRVLSMLLRREGEQRKTNQRSGDEFAAEAGPVAYIATVVRNVDTFNCFAEAAAAAELSVSNITSDAAPENFLPYMLSYDRSSVQLLKITTLS